MPYTYATKVCPYTQTGDKLLSCPSARIRVMQDTPLQIGPLPKIIIPFFPAFQSKFGRIGNTWQVLIFDWKAKKNGS